jgi:hypothetical protein
MTIYRYPTDVEVTSTQNGFADVLDWLGFLCAKDYLCDVLTGVHGLSPADAPDRALQIIPHVRTAMGFIQQSLEGPADLAFLPAYYAILNLSKVYVLLGPRHADLPSHRRHGASYEVERKDSHTVLTELISLWPAGAFALFYETLTRRRMPSKKFDLQVKTLLPRILNIGHEYALATGGGSQLCTLRPGTIQLPTGIHAIAIVDQLNRDLATAVPTFSKRQVRCLRGFLPPPGAVGNRFIGGPIINPAHVETEIRAQLRTHLIFRFRDQTVAALGPTKIEFPEEVPIWLLFFYMSSIVRYKPEFFSRLKDSRYWPPLSSARLHCFLDFLLAFWSFVHQKNYFLKAP